MNGDSYEDKVICNRKSSLNKSSYESLVVPKCYRNLTAKYGIDRTILTYSN